MGNEKSFENQIKTYLKNKGIYPLGYEKQKMIKNPIGYYEKRFANRNTGSGLPDMHIVIHGFSFEIEIKSENGKPSNLQLQICNQIRNSGSFAAILYPSGFERFKDIINDICELGKYVVYNEIYPLILK